METVEYIQKQYASVKRQLDAVILDTSEEQINWAPHGTANSIGETLVHMSGSLDNAFQAVLQGKPRLWESEAWGEKFGLTGTPGRVHGWDEIKGKHLALEPVLGYVAAVINQVDQCVAGLTSGELDQLVTLNGNERPAADVFILQFSHVLGHAGEIAALKGMQGVKGLPF
jgi:hypothetical protein